MHSLREEEYKVILEKVEKRLSHFYTTPNKRYNFLEILIPPTSVTLSYIFV